VAAANEADHWADMGIFHVAREPWVHLMNWVEKEATDTKARMKNLFSLDSDANSTVQRLVYSKASAIKLEFSALLEPAAYSDETKWGQVWEHVGGERTERHAQCVLYVLEAACDFEMRIIKGITQNPDCRLVWLVRRPHAQKCPDRLAVAKDRSGQRNPGGRRN
jgi:hypothetical protein